MVQIQVLLPAQQGGKAMEDIKLVDIEKFEKLGFLQEVNRKFFHPLGFSLEAITDKDGKEELYGIWDYQNDPEGIFFGRGIIKQSKIDYVEELRKNKIDYRMGAQKYYNIKVNEEGIQII